MKKPFESLKSLFFKRMSEWREWISDEESREAFPLLEKLHIEHCPNLAKVLPSHHLPRVTRLTIRGCEQLATPLPRFPRLHSLDVSGFHSLESLREKIDQMGCSPSDLREISIQGLDSLKCVALDSVWYAKPWSPGEWDDYVHKIGLKKGDKVILTMQEEENGERIYRIRAERKHFGFWYSIDDQQ
jgi:hypothetical protein